MCSSFFHIFRYRDSVADVISLWGQNMKSNGVLLLSISVAIGSAACRKVDGTGVATSDSDAQALVNGGYACLAGS